MSNVAIVYWSGTGNTEAMADFIAEGVEAKGGTTTIIQAADFGVERVPEFDAFAFGCPAMGDEELEDTEFLPMYDEVEPLMAGEKLASSARTTGTTANGWTTGCSGPKKLECSPWKP